MNNTIHNQTLSKFILLVFIAFLFIFHQFGYIGHYGFDDMQYAELASNFLQGNIDFEDHFTFRFTIILFTSISYLLFGINDFASSLPSIIVTSSILYMVYRISKKQGAVWVFIALSLTTLSTWFLSYSDKLMPDIYLATCVMFSFYLFHQYRFSKKRRNPILYGVLFSFSLFLGFCSKGTVVLIIPWLIYLLISDIKQNRDWAFWSTVTISGIGFLATYFIAIYSLTGEASQRFDAIASNAYLNRCSYDKQSIKILAKRLFIELPNLFMREGMLTSYLFIIPVFISKFFFRIRRENKEANYAINSSIILLLASNFMTISPTAYIPMCLDTRHFLFIIPMAAVAATYAIRNLYNSKLSLLSFIIINLIIIGFMIYDGNSISWKLYGLILILGLLFRFINLKSLTWLFGVLLFGILFNSIYGLFDYAQYLSYNQQRTLIFKEVLSMREPCYVITNEVQKRIGRYYQEFDPNHPVQLLSYHRFDQDTLKDLPIYILENRHTRNLASYNENDLPIYVRHKSEKDFLIVNNKELGISLTHIERIRDLEKEAVNLTRSLNDFEHSLPQWKQEDKHLNSNYHFTGNQSILCPMYSSTYILELDSSITNQLNESLFISTKAMIWTADKTEASLVVSIENKDGSYHYESTRLNKYIHSFSNWWQVNLKLLISPKELKTNSTLKVYIHNPDQNTIYLDDFEVELKSL